MRLILISGVLSALAASPGGAQLLPIRPGDHVRVANADSASLGLWRVGTVLNVSRRALVFANNGGDSVSVELGPRWRVGIGSPSAGHALLWGAVGLTAGGALGATVLSRAFDGEQLGQGRGLETIGFATIGGLLGIVAGMAAGPRRWEDVELTAEGIPAAPLTVAASPSARIGERAYWRRFPATGPDFGAFFQAYEDSLAPVEGVWEILTAGSVAPRHLAIARDSRYAGFDYVAVQLPRPGASLATTRGRIAWALRGDESPTAFTVQPPNGGAALRADLLGTELILYRLDGTTEKWIRLFPVIEK